MVVVLDQTWLLYMGFCPPLLVRSVVNIRLCIFLPHYVVWKALILKGVLVYRTNIPRRAYKTSTGVWYVHYHSLAQVYTSTAIECMQEQEGDAPVV